MCFSSLFCVKKCAAVPEAGIEWGCIHNHIWVRDINMCIQIYMFKSLPFPLSLAMTLFQRICFVSLPVAIPTVRAACHGGRDLKSVFRCKVSLSLFKSILKSCRILWKSTQKYFSKPGTCKKCSYLWMRWIIATSTGICRGGSKHDSHFSLSSFLKKATSALQHSVELRIYDFPNCILLLAWSNAVHLLCVALISLRLCWPLPCKELQTDSKDSLAIILRTECSIQKYAIWNTPPWSNQLWSTLLAMIQYLWFI